MTVQRSHSSIYVPLLHVQEADECISVEEMAEVMLKHTEEMRKLQHEYE